MKKLFENLSLKSRIIILVFIIIQLLASLHFLYTNKTQSKILIGEFLYSNEVTTKYLATSFKLAIETNNLTLIRNMMSWVKNDPWKVKFIILYDNNNEIVAQYPDHLPLSYERLFKQKEIMNTENDLFIDYERIIVPNFGNFEMFIGFSKAKFIQKQ